MVCFASGPRSAASSEDKICDELKLGEYRIPRQGEETCAFEQSLNVHCHGTLSAGKASDLEEECEISQSRDACAPVRRFFVPVMNPA
jgi:hypothetical protein